MMEPFPHPARAPSHFQCEGVAIVASAVSTTMDSRAPLQASLAEPPPPPSPAAAAATVEAPSLLRAERCCFTADAATDAAVADVVGVPRSRGLWRGVDML